MDVPTTRADPSPDYRESPYLRFGATSVQTGDPETPELFTQALIFLEAITDHFAEFGPWDEKTPRDLVDELNHHNGWAQAEGTLSEGEEITLTQLQALSRRRLLALEKPLEKSFLGQVFAILNHWNPLESNKIPGFLTFFPVFNFFQRFLEETSRNTIQDERLIRYIDQLIVQAVAAETEMVRLAILSDPDPQRAYKRLLATLPLEEMVEPDHPVYAALEGFGGCLTCASGHPCQIRMDEDVGEILAAAELSESEALTCLHWMIVAGYSSLTHDIARMAEAFSLIHSQSAEELPVDPPHAETSLPALAEEEITRLERPIDPSQSCRSRG